METTEKKRKRKVNPPPEPPKPPEGEPAAPSGAAPAPPAMPPEPTDADTEKAGEAWKALRLDSATVCREVAQECSGQLAALYDLWALGAQDPRYALHQIEVRAQTRALTIGLMVYGDAAKPFLLPIIFGIGLLGPVIARLFFMPPDPRKNGMQPAPTPNGKPA